jgi:hypothetical protein
VRGQYPMKQEKTTVTNRDLWIFIITLILGMVFILGFITSCSPSELGDGQSSPPVKDCDFTEYSTGPEFDLDKQQFITTLPVFSENTLCGSFESVDTFYDVDTYLFPLVSTSKIEPVLVNFVVDVDGENTPVIDFYYKADDLPLIQIGHFVGGEGFLNILDWPIWLAGDYQNDLVIVISSYNPLDGIVPYDILFW